MRLIVLLSVLGTVAASARPAEAQRVIDAGVSVRPYVVRAVAAGPRHAGRQGATLHALAMPHDDPDTGPDVTAIGMIIGALTGGLLAVRSSQQEDDMTGPLPFVLGAALGTVAGAVVGHLLGPFFHPAAGTVRD